MDVIDGADREPPLDLAEAGTGSGFQPAFFSASRRYLSYCESRSGTTVVRSRNSFVLRELDRNERNEAFRPRREV